MTLPMTNNLSKSWYLRYGLSILAVVAGYFLRLALTQWVGPDLPTYITFYPFVMLAALVGGIGPGILATVMAALLVDYWVLAPIGAFHITTFADAVGLAFFTSMGLFMSVVAGLYRNTRDKLETMVATRTQELSEAHAALQQQVALVDPARAESIAREMQRLIRDTRVTPPTPEVIAFRQVPWVTGALVMCVGLTVLVGWLAGFEPIKRVWPGFVTMKANTALCLVLAGGALLLHARRAWRTALAGLVGAIGLLTLVECVAGVNLGMDQLFFREVGQLPTAPPGRMAPATAVNFILMSLALLGMKTKRDAVRLIGQELALAMGIVGAIATIGYVYGEPGFYGFGSTTSMALITAVSFVVLAIGLLFAGTEGPASLLRGSSPGAQLVRRLLPAILVVPIGLGWLCEKGIGYGFYGENLDTAIFAMAMMILLAVLIWWTAATLDQADAIRKERETQLRNQAELMDQAADALVVRELGGVIRFWNRGSEQLYGWPAVEVVGRQMRALLHTEGLPDDLDAQLQQHQHWEGELTQTTRNGTRVIVESRKTSIRADDGQILVLESNRDITRRRKAEAEAARLHGELEKTAAEIRQTNETLVSSRRAALNLMDDAVGARERAEQINLKLHLLQEKEKADAIRLARAQSAANTIRAMHEGVLLLELDGTIIFVNPAVERLTGLWGSALVGRNIEALLPTFMAGDDLHAAQRGLEVLRSGQQPDFPSLQLRKTDGRIIHILPSVSLMDAPEEGGPRTAVLTLKDVTELHDALHRQAENERKYRELVENANSIIIRITPEHTILFFNEYAQQFFGYEAEEVLGRNVVGTIVPDVDSEGRDLRQVMQAITAHPESYASNENENMCKDGRRVWVHWANRAVCDAQGHISEILCVGADITQRREMEKEARRYQERLRELAERLAANEEDARWRISRYIHDSVIQNLSLSNIRLGAMVKSLHDASLPEEVSKLGQIRELLSQAIDECRMVMSDLTPALLYELGLIPALNDLARQLEAKYGAKVVVEPDGTETPIPQHLRGFLFESTRELLMNALKHAGPCEIRVAVSYIASELIIRVKDNGQGFVSSAASATAERKGGFGLLNIRQRVEGLGGQLEINSMPGKGTTATIRVPVKVDPDFDT